MKVDLLLQNELWISLGNPPRVVRVWLDWQDYGETRDGLPVMHYRIETKKSDRDLSDEIRAANLTEAELAIITLFQ